MHPEGAVIDGDRHRPYIRTVSYFEEARHIWTTYVPSRGQAETVQGELLRSVEKLRDEAQRNGNVNFGEGHVRLARLLEETLTTGPFDATTKQQIRDDVARLLDAEHPATNDPIYDRLTDRVVEWCRAHPDPVVHALDPNLSI